MASGFAATNFIRTVDVRGLNASRPVPLVAVPMPRTRDRPCCFEMATTTSFLAKETAYPGPRDTYSTEDGACPRLGSKVSGCFVRSWTTRCGAECDGERGFEWSRETN